MLNHSTLCILVFITYSFNLNEYVNTSLNSHVLKTSNFIAVIAVRNEGTYQVDDKDIHYRYIYIHTHKHTNRIYDTSFIDHINNIMTKVIRCKKRAKLLGWKLEPLRKSSQWFME